MKKAKGKDKKKNEKKRREKNKEKKKKDGNMMEDNNLQSPRVANKSTPTNEAELLLPRNEKGSGYNVQKMQISNVHLPTFTADRPLSRINETEHDSQDMWDPNEYFPIPADVANLLNITENETEHNMQDIRDTNENAPIPADVEDPLYRREIEINELKDRLHRCDKEIEDLIQVIRDSNKHEPTIPVDVEDPLYRREIELKDVLRRQDKEIEDLIERLRIVEESIVKQKKERNERLLELANVINLQMQNRNEVERVARILTNAICLCFFLTVVVAYCIPFIQEFKTGMVIVLTLFWPLLMYYIYLMGTLYYLIHSINYLKSVSKASVN